MYGPRVQPWSPSKTGPHGSGDCRAYLPGSVIERMYWTSAGS